MSAQPFYINNPRRSSTIIRAQNVITRNAHPRARSQQQLTGARRPPSIGRKQSQTKQAPKIHIKPHQFQTFNAPLPQLEQDTPSKEAHSTIQQANTTRSTSTANRRETSDSSKQANEAMAIDISDDLNAILGIDTTQSSSTQNNSNHKSANVSTNASNSQMAQISAPPKKKRKITNGSNNKTQAKKHKKRAKKANNKSLFDADNKEFMDLMRKMQSKYHQVQNKYNAHLQKSNTTYDAMRTEHNKIVSELEALKASYGEIVLKNAGLMEQIKIKNKLFMDLNTKLKAMVVDKNASTVKKRQIEREIKKLKEKLKEEKKNQIRMIKEHALVLNKYKTIKNMYDNSQIDLENIESSEINNVNINIFNDHTSDVNEREESKEIQALERRASSINKNEIVFDSIESVDANHGYKKEIDSLKKKLQKETNEHLQSKTEANKCKETVANLLQRQKELENKISIMEAGDWNGVIVSEYEGSDGEIMYQMRWNDSFGLTCDDVTDNDLKTWQAKKLKKAQSKKKNKKRRRSHA